MKFIAGFMLMIAPLAFAAESGTKNPAATLQWQSAEHIWRSSCQYCHENTPFAPKVLGRNLPVELSRYFIRNGGAGMPVFRLSELSDAEVEMLAQWIYQSQVQTQLPVSEVAK